MLGPNKRRLLAITAGACGERQAGAGWSAETVQAGCEPRTIEDGCLKPVGRQEAESVHCTGIVIELLALPSTDTVTSVAPVDTPAGTTKSILVMPTAPGIVPE